LVNGVGFNKTFLEKCHTVDSSMARPPGITPLASSSSISISSNNNNNNISNSNSNNSSTHPRQWTPPTWLNDTNSTSTGDKQNSIVGTGNGTIVNISSTATKGGSGGNQFVLPIPPVPEDIAKEVSTKFLSSSKPFFVQESRIRLLTAKRNDQRERVTGYEEQLSELENQKEYALSDIISARKKEKDDAMNAIEEKLRTKYIDEFTVREQKILADFQEECDNKRKILREKHEKQRQEEKEQSMRRLELLEAVEADNESEGAQGGQSSLLVLLDETNNEQVQLAKKKIEEKRTELAELEANLVTLTDSRSEMIWLLKQVIKAEEKQKIKIDKEKQQQLSEANKNSSTSRQA
jgi:hypothetical protein